MKFREGFVSNSSSTSFVVVGRSGVMQIPTSNNNTITVDDNYVFDWEPETTSNTKGRIAWAVMQAQYQGNADWLQMVTDVVHEVSGFTLVCPINLNGESYIDHESIGNYNEIFADKDTLKAWIFDKDSYVTMGNDNVSNSSSSSFVIFGKYFHEDEFNKMCNLTDEDVEDIRDNGVEDANCFNEKIKEHLKGLTFLRIDGDIIIGEFIGGDRKIIIKDMDTVIAALGDDCGLYTGIDYDGEIRLN